jgi:acetolactate synthase-1/2/3 large subunit
MMNLQELQTIVGNRLPIKIFVLNNAGYHSIRQTQHNYFPDNEIGVGPGSGVTLPDYVSLAQAFGFDTIRCERVEDVPRCISAALNSNGPFLADVLLDPAQDFSPKLASRVLPNGAMASPALEDMAPFLPRDELTANMLIPLMD